MDDYSIQSRGTHFSHQDGDDMDWVIGTDYGPGGTTINGIIVNMGMANDSATDLDDIYATYQGEDRLVSRSQAKRLLNRFDRFREVVLDFEGVESIGQAFADEVLAIPRFLVHPEVKRIPIQQNEAV